MTRPLEGRSIVITGAGQGLGASYARLCAALGASVLVADVNGSTAGSVAAEISTAGATAIPAVVDVRDPAAVNALAGACLARFGSLDGWVNNAALQPLGRIDEMDPATVARVVEVNVLGAIYGTAAAGRIMSAQGSGSIVNITSGAQGGMRDLSVYGATKGAVASLTYAASLDLAGFGVRVNALSPLAATQMTVDGDEHWARDGQPPTTGLLPPPENNAAAVAFLLSDRASDVTGQVVRVDGSGIALVGHPKVLYETTVAGSDWTYEMVAAAFDETLRASMVPVGHQSPARDN